MTAVNGVDFVAHFGEMLFIVGPSGSGKTTLLSMVSGILRPNAGTVSVDGDDIWTLTNDQLADFRLNRIGFVFQDYHLVTYNRAIEYIPGTRFTISYLLVQAKSDAAIAGIKPLTGYGLGIGLVTPVISIAKALLPNYAAITTFWNLALSFGMVVLIAGVSSYISVRKVLKIEPFDIFRG